MRSRWIVLASLAFCTAPAMAREPALPAGFKIDRVVLVMRHGVRPPTKAQPMPAGVTPDAWPSWPVKPGWLTPHGAKAVATLGADDGATYRAARLLSAKGCPAVGTVAIVADSDQRTIATAEAWKEALAPGCAIASSHKPEGEPDPLFSGIEAELAPYDPAAADAAVAQAVGAGGIHAVEAAQHSLLKRLDAILCGNAKSACGVGQEPTALVPAAPRTRPKLSGALDRASTAAQILLLEYADGKPLPEVGWGRANARDIADLSAFHALEFRLVARPAYVATRNLAGLLPILRDALAGRSKATVTMISGHDTQIANLAGLLDLHWHIPGFAEDDPAPGGAIVLERLSGPGGAAFVRLFYRAQALDAIRQGTPGTVWQLMPIAGCHERNVVGLCTLAQFEAKLGT